MNDSISPHLLHPWAADYKDTLPINQALALADVTDTAALMASAAHLRDQGFRNVITYSRKVFLPIT